MSAPHRCGQTPGPKILIFHSRTGRRGPTSYITEAVRHQLAMDGLAEIVASHEEEYGTLTEPETEQEIEAARRSCRTPTHQSTARPITSRTSRSVTVPRTCWARP
ncbi:hypothetical protein ACFXPV_24740 [Streptomyces sp. NPDC059118]|uniref:hypothetical protein n=1 Tax=unclassified Streptomyces TaxID=2593676 RepID=UPI0036962377